MKHVFFENTGDPAAVVQWKDSPPPLLIPGHVRLQMLYSPVNPADLNFIAGHYGKKPELPSTPGMEGVGRITEIGEGVAGLTPGQLAIPLGGMGCWAEEIVRPAESVFALPEGIDPRQAAMLRVNPATAWGLLHAGGPLPKGAWVAQNAGSSAAGHCVIQLARHLGLRTLSLVRREESIAECTDLGGDAALLDSTEAVTAARALPGFALPALALNAVSGDSAVRLMDLLGPGGTMVTYGAMSRQPVKVPNGFLIFKGIHLRGFWVTQWLESAPADEVRMIYRELAELVVTGAIRQTIAAEYPLQEIKTALVHATASARGGKVIVKIIPE
ncbi:MAG TPA: 2-enoyl thioester reductase domain-containing protein [Verrucomicrobiales bacterium]|nr:2-enoyl thioester reductase domain-containing protein [Verrucomicrobiales bacterium]